MRHCREKNLSLMKYNAIRSFSRASPFSASALNPVMPEGAAGSLPGSSPGCAGWDQNM